MWSINNARGYRGLHLPDPWEQNEEVGFLTLQSPWKDDGSHRQHPITRGEVRGRQSGNQNMGVSRWRSLGWGSSRRAGLRRMPGQPSALWGTFHSVKIPQPTMDETYSFPQGFPSIVRPQIDFWSSKKSCGEPLIFSGVGEWGMQWCTILLN